ncbi:chorismate synthase-domain-containing protein [Dunaliella salina]|uniref:chorismate synthase n=1 Tax=Dunaliella salina TaxID=3046 RepID=A0ABQ7GAI8_DUNSA|nr:chorismate synthase-domain-containing protein [Dunaliella salina]|eukprot:KAF5831626.1 chorismate synthase-domain-containing protein [Dunaliella salina]
MPCSGFMIWDCLILQRVKDAESRTVSTSSPHPFEDVSARASGSTYGTLFRVTTFGESHGRGVGCVVDGVPPRLPISQEEIQLELDRRRPGQSLITTPRKEEDTCEVLSGVGDGVSLGSPIAILVRNKDQRSQDYGEMSVAYRPSHADATYDFKYGIRAVAGGGRSSARETIGRVAAVCVCVKLCVCVCVLGYVNRVADVESNVDNASFTMADVESNMVRCPDQDSAARMIDGPACGRDLEKDVSTKGSSCGKKKKRLLKVAKATEKKQQQQPPVAESTNVMVTCRAVLCGEISNCSCMHAEGILRVSPIQCLTHSDGPMRGFEICSGSSGSRMLGVASNLGFEIGSGFSGSRMLGSEHNDEFYMDENNEVRTRTNRSGGIQGGLANGEDIIVRVAFKPTSTIAQKQRTVTREGVDTELRAKGRHDACVVPRAVPMVESMVALVLADQMLQHYAQCELLPRGADAIAVDSRVITQFSKVPAL